MTAYFSNGKSGRGLANRPAIILTISLPVASDHNQSGTTHKIPVHVNTDDVNKTFAGRNVSPIISDHYYLVCTLDKLLIDNTHDIAN